MEVLLLDYNSIYQQNMGCEKLSKKTSVREEIH